MASVKSLLVKVQREDEVRRFNILININWEDFSSRVSFTTNKFTRQNENELNAWGILNMHFRYSARLKNYLVCQKSATLSSTKTTMETTFQ